MAWDNWLTENKFTLFRSAIIQEQFIQCIIDHTKKNGIILEAGFGFGTTTELLRDLDYQVYGFDLEEVAIAKTSKRFPLLNNKLYVGNILCEDSYRMTYDTIIHQGVLEHFNDDEIVSILKMQAKNCKKIVFDVPNANRKNTDDEGDGTRFEKPEFWESIISHCQLSFKRFGRNYDYGNDFLPKHLSRYDSDLMKKIGRSSIFVIKGEVE